MAKCPKCGANIARPLKIWSMVNRTSKKVTTLRRTIGLYNCPTCKRNFRMVGKKTTPVKCMIDKIKEVERGLLQTLTNLREKLDNLESEKADLFTEIEKLKKVGEEKASSLEEEVATLRKEVESLKTLLDTSEYGI